MKSKINNETLELARQLRQLTQREAAEAIGISQGKLSKAEHGLQELDIPILETLAKFYEIPLAFFYRELDPTPVSHYYYRKKITSNKLTDSFVSLVQIFKIFIEEFLKPIELPEFDLQLYTPSQELSVQEIANRTRFSLGIFKGPVPNLTTLLENHGILIVKIDFGTNKLDGLSTYTSKGRRIIFLNTQMPNDRMRFSLAHELGHMIMHSGKLPLPGQDVENEANEFASQFLMPEEEISPMLYGINMYDLVTLKKRWRVSMKALIYRAKSLMTINDRTYRNLQIFYSKKGYNHGEPYPLPFESPTLLYETVNIYKNELGYTDSELMELMTIGPIEYKKFFSPSLPFRFNPFFRK